jgi:pyruvate dehydrogenase E2 component (dihydrolipoyllysine-residue acetyltransferase)
MAIEVRLPQYGMAMQEGTIVQWFKHEGDQVTAGELLAEIEAEKATEELAAPGSGVLEQILVPEGETVPVRELLALLDPGDGGPADTAVGVRSPEVPEVEVPAPAAPGAGAADEQTVLIPLDGIRGRIAERMQSSLRAMAQLTLTTTADVTDLVAYRDRWPDQPRPSYPDMVVKAVALALRRHPMLNATVEGDHIRLLPHVHIGIATAVEEGLLVPVVRDPDRKSLGQIAAESAALIERVRAGEFGVAQVTGGTFTVSSLGGLGIDAFTPIINPPEVAILGIGRIVDQPARDGDRLVWRKVMTLSLTIDHRVVDGSPGAAFLATVSDLLANPIELGD